MISPFSASCDSRRHRPRLGSVQDSTSARANMLRTVTVIAGVDFRTNTSDGRPFGVTTTYCQGYAGACPDFVKNALNI